jgi:ABC-type dipeptide/oligopeptide/nickel transport system ATPase component
VIHYYGLTIDVEESEIVDSGPAEQVLSRPRHPYTQQLVVSIRGQWEFADGQSADPAAAVDTFTHPPTGRTR